MDRGMTAVRSRRRRRSPSPATGDLLKTVGMTLVSTVGGAQRPALRHVLPALWPRRAGDVGDRRRRGLRRRAPGRVDGRRRAGQGRGRGQDDVRRLAPPWTRSSARWPPAPTSASALQAAAAAAAAGRDATVPHAGPQGPGQLSRRAQRGAPGSRCDQHDDDSRNRRRDVVLIGVVSERTASNT